MSWSHKAVKKVDEKSVSWIMKSTIEQNMERKFIELREELMTVIQEFFGDLSTRPDLQAVIERVKRLESSFKQMIESHMAASKDSSERQSKLFFDFIKEIRNSNDVFKTTTNNRVESLETQCDVMLSNQVTKNDVESILTLMNLLETRIVSLEIQTPNEKISERREMTPSEIEEIEKEYIATDFISEIREIREKLDHLQVSVNENEDILRMFYNDQVETNKIQVETNKILSNKIEEQSRIIDELKKLLSH